MANLSPPRGASPIARKQRLLYPGEHPMAMAPVIRNPRLGFFGATVGQSALKTASTAGAGFAAASSGAAIAAGSAIGLGAAAGSVVPVIGTAIGAIIGLIASGVFSKKSDPEVADLGAALTLWHKSGQNPQAIYNLANKYLYLAGLMDLTPSQVAPSSFPVYKKYGRMGEINFARDLTKLIYSAAQSGQITANDTPLTVWNNVVLPWMDSWGFGRNVDKGGNGNFMDVLEQGMVIDYLTGMWHNWASRTGSRAEMAGWPDFKLPLPAAAVAQVQPVALATAPAVYQPQPINAPIVANAPAIPTNYLLVGNANGQPVYLSPTNTFYTLSGGALIAFTGTLPYQGATVQITNGQAQPATPTTVQIPAGYTLIGMANGLSAYQGLDGNYYSWNGSNMTLLTGTLTASSGQSANVVNGQIQQAASTLPSLSMASQQSYNTATAPYVATVAVPTSAVSPSYATAAPSTPVTAAGVTGAGLPSWLPWAAIGGVLIFMFAGARPVGKMDKPRA